MQTHFDLAVTFLRMHMARNFHNKMQQIKRFEASGGAQFFICRNKICESWHHVSAFH